MERRGPGESGDRKGAEGGVKVGSEAEFLKIGTERRPSGQAAFRPLICGWSLLLFSAKAQKEKTEEPEHCFGCINL